ncbi:unnamed protein product [Camellia sinensis]
MRLYEKRRDAFLREHTSQNWSQILPLSLILGFISNGRSAIPGFPSQYPPRARRMVQYPLGSVAAEAMAPAHSQARTVHRSRRLSGWAGDALIQLYRNFITDFETKINLLKLAHFAVIVSWQYPEKEASIGYLEEGSQKECKKLLEDRKSTLDSMTDIDPSVYANYYWVSSQYHKSRQEFAEFYKSALLYLAYTLVESLSESFKLDLAFDLSLAALLGENIYNFGELLAHPI